MIKKKETITTLSESSEQEALLCQIASLFAFIFNFGEIARRKKTIW
jgi:hypothetical protein